MFHKIRDLVIRVTARRTQLGLNGGTLRRVNMHDRWISACQEASQPLKWYDWLTIAIITGSALLAVIGWFVFDGTRGL